MTDAIATLKSLAKRLRQRVCGCDHALWLKRSHAGVMYCSKDQLGECNCTCSVCEGDNAIEQAAAVIGALAEAMSEPSDEAVEAGAQAWNRVVFEDAIENEYGLMSRRLLHCALKAANAVQLERIAKTAAKEAT